MVDVSRVGAWDLIDDEWVIYQSQLDEIIEKHGIWACPECNDSEKGVSNMVEDDKFVRGICDGCGKRLCIIKDVQRETS
jgi:hypothetical protein